MIYYVASFVHVEAAWRPAKRSSAPTKPPEV
jgi:hypothetical protein